MTASEETKLRLSRRLSTQTGITEAIALELVNLLGTDWSSLIREARLFPPEKPKR